jgi:transposase
MNIDEVAKATGRSESSVKRWLSWNKNGFGGLAPNFKGGRPFMVTPDQWTEILKEIRGKGMTIHFDFSLSYTILECTSTYHDSLGSYVKIMRNKTSNG